VEKCSQKVTLLQQVWTETCFKLLHPVVECIPKHSLQTNKPDRENLNKDCPEPLQLPSSRGFEPRLFEFPKLGP
jgi:hypothetical protein